MPILKLSLSLLIRTFHRTLLCPLTFKTVTQANPFICLMFKGIAQNEYHQWCFCRQLLDYPLYLAATNHFEQSARVFLGMNSSRFINWHVIDINIIHSSFHCFLSKEHLLLIYFGTFWDYIRLNLTKKENKYQNITLPQAFECTLWYRMHVCDAQ